MFFRRRGFAALFAVLAISVAFTASAVAGTVDVSHKSISTSYANAAPEVAVDNSSASQSVANSLKTSGVGSSEYHQMQASGVTTLAPVGSNNFKSETVVAHHIKSHDQTSTAA